LVHRDYEAKTTKVKVLKVKFQNLGENGAESYFTWEPKSGSFIPHVINEVEKEQMPWE
jgi:twinkle protein